MRGRIRLIKCPEDKYAELCCESCGAEYKVSRQDWDGFIHPSYTQEWDLVWHLYHPISVIYPKLVELVWMAAKNGKIVCPHCSSTEVLIITECQFDLPFLKKSILNPEKPPYICARCDKEFESGEDVTHYDGSHICADCLVFL